MFRFFHKSDAELLESLKKCIKESGEFLGDLLKNENAEHDKSGKILRNRISDLLTEIEGSRKSELMPQLVADLEKLYHAILLHMIHKRILLDAKNMPYAAKYLYEDFYETKPKDFFALQADIKWLRSNASNAMLDQLAQRVSNNIQCYRDIKALSQHRVVLEVRPAESKHSQSLAMK